LGPRAVLLQPAIIPRKLSDYFLTAAIFAQNQKRKGGHVTASNFKILMHQSGESLNLKLSGDFDGTSAFELLHVLKEKGRDVQSVIIDTSTLGRVHPFGQGVLRKRLSELGSDGEKLLFTGDKADLVSL
jgi:anti-anti-sigma regulatory factor